MKKFISILLVLLFLLTMAACGTANKDSNTDAPTTTTANDDQPTGDGEETEPEDDNSQIIYEPREFEKDATIEETILVDENGVKITATELTYGNYSAELDLVIENNSDKDLSFIANSVGYSCNSVNGYMISEGYLNCDVAAGKKANDTISISYEALMVYGIFEIADIEIGFDISDSDYNHTYTGPRSVVTTAADGYDYKIPCYRETIASQESQAQYEYSVPYFSDEPAYEEGGLIIASQVVMQNKNGESILLLEVVNTTENIVSASTTNIDINGLRICDSTWSYDSIAPGKTAIVDVTLSSVLEAKYWEIYGIEEIGNIALTVSFKDTDSNEIANPAFISIDIPDSEASFSMEGTEIYNDNGIRIISKGVHKDPSEYSDDLHLLLIAENTSGQSLGLHDVYGSLSVNDFMAKYSFPTTTMEDGTSSIIDVTLWGYGLEDIKISDPAKIQTISFSVSIKDSKYKEVTTAEISFKAP